jgi:hypothetical protein
MMRKEASSMKSRAAQGHINTKAKVETTVVNPDAASCKTAVQTEDEFLDSVIINDGCCRSSTVGLVVFAHTNFWLGHGIFKIVSFLSAKKANKNEIHFCWRQVLSQGPTKMKSELFLFLSRLGQCRRQKG